MRIDLNNDENLAIAQVAIAQEVSRFQNKVGKTVRGVSEDRITKKRPKIHSFFVNSAQFVIDAKYSPLNPIGHGAYGVVCSAVDQTNDKKVAIKKIPNAFEDLIDAKRILREVKLLRHLSHDNVCGLYDLIEPPNSSNFEDVYMVLPFMETDLHKIIYSKNKLTDDHIQYFIYQILRGLKYIHSANVIHRDLKPSNILLNGNCDLKICDFGLARGVDDSDFKLTEYVVTRWYRAPEVMCSCQEYDKKIDVWSVGCIMAELHAREPIFPGNDYIQQMNLIFDVVGTPTKEDTDFITNPKALQYIRGMEKKDPVPLKKMYPDANPTAVDLMSRMLTFNPNKRISVNDALDHNYFKSLRLKDTEVECELPFNFDFEKMKLTSENVQKCMLEEIALFRPYVDSTEISEKKRSQKTT
eukprot:CAMPEP_0185280744 /NCGR_PEP_ID=MMETSP1359-20130426/66324_1 /TAXON_ID=552665 /ORGANISM="Bigelowiella longifila, Strain CCMP242" /LENGTH=411 /DNA_ID=CAMNT_0027876081 /DNA_START=1133 /DNA_END=2370 /DNA_ORIENTATION=+